jgi:hypothetical protein
MGRPRLIRERNAKGKLRPIPPNRDEAYEVRMRRFGVTVKQSRSPLAGYLAGVLCLRGDITREELAHFFSFLQLCPDMGVKAIVLREHIDGGSLRVSRSGSKTYHLMVKGLGRERIEILRELANDRLICPVDVLRDVLAQVPLTRAGFGFMFSC